MQFIQNSLHPKPLAELFSYLQERPGSLIDEKKIQRFLGVNLKLVHELFIQLEKENVGTLISPFSHPDFSLSQTHHSKFYFNQKEFLLETSHYRPDQSGALFEQEVFIFLRNKVKKIWFMRTTDDIEVDFIIQTTKTDEFWALELQKDQFIYASDLQGLHFFHRSFPLVAQLMVLHMGTRDNKEGIISVVPYEKALALF